MPTGDLLTGFLFGNVAANGQLEGEEWDDEVRQALSALGGQGAAMMGSLVREVLLDETTATSSTSVQETSVSTTVKMTAPAKEFLVDEDDYDEEDDDTEQVVTVTTSSKTTTRVTFQTMPVTPPSSNLITAPSMNNFIPIKSVHDEFPTFSRDAILKFGELLTMPALRKRLRPAKRLTKRQRQSLNNLPSAFDAYESDSDEMEMLLSQAPETWRRWHEKRSARCADTSALGSLTTGKRAEDLPVYDVVRRACQRRLKHAWSVASVKGETPREWEETMQRDLLPVMVEQWENDVVWSDEDEKKWDSTFLDKGLFVSAVKKQSHQQQQAAPSPSEAEAQLKQRLKRLVSRIPNYALDFGDWDERIMWDDTALPEKCPLLHLVLYSNDPYIPLQYTLSEPKSQRLAKLRKEKEKAAALAAAGNAQSNAQNVSNYLDRFNLSNDRFYEVPKHVQSGHLRHTSKAVIIHSVPALRLDPSFYPLIYTKNMLRQGYRLSCPLPPVGHEAKWVPLRDALRARKRGPVYRALTDLSLQDVTPTLLLEYCEEAPLMMMKSGMTTLIHHYYRKLNDADDSVPEVRYGSVVVLEQRDTAPFMGFGEVKPGEMVSCLYNNLFVAPIFEQPHPCNDTDFLFVMRREKSGQVAAEYTFFMRLLPPLFVVGQCFPSLEVPAPQSRRIIHYLRDRAHVTAHRIFCHPENIKRRLDFTRFAKLFTQVATINLRKYLKEYADLTRRGKHAGTWQWRASVQDKNDAELQKLVEPEHVCLYESMLIYQQRLHDLGFAVAEEETQGADEEQDESNLASLEVLLAPWTLTRNFLNASKGMAMLKLYGAGDPTGCNQGLSFLRTSMKKMFYRQNAHPTPAEIAASQVKFSLIEQQQAYKDEIERLWQTQRQVLSDPNPPPDEEEQVLMQPSIPLMDRPGPRSSSSFWLESPPAVSSSQVKDDASSVFSAASTQQRGKTLIITRKYKQEDGTEKEEQQSIDDSRLINAYLRQKQLEKARKYNGKMGVFYSYFRRASALPEELEMDVDTTSHHQKSIYWKRRQQALIARAARLAKEASGGGSVKKQPSAASAGVAAERAHRLALDKLKQSLEERCSHCGALHPEHLCPLMQPLEKKQRKPGVKKGKKETATSATNALLDDKDDRHFRRRRPLTELSNVFDRIYSQLLKVPNSWPFHQPVNIKHAPNYYEVIKNPKDLATLRRDIRQLKFTNREAFVQELQIMLDNCVQYNGPDSGLTAVARQLHQTALSCIEKEDAVIKELEEQIIHDNRAAAQSVEDDVA